MKKILALILCLAMLVGMVPMVAAAEDYREPITLTVYNALGNYSGEAKGWFAKEIKDRFNVTLNFIGYNLDNSVFNAGLAAGEMGDIIVLGDLDNQFLKILDAGLLFDWSELDLTPYTNINTYMTDAMASVSAYVKEARNIDGVWGFGHNVALENGTWSNLTDPDYALQVRFDAWEKAGKPAMTSLEALPDFLEALQNAVPETETGEKVYAYGGFGDWEDCIMKFTWDLMTFYGFQEFDFMGVNYATREIVNPLEEGSLYYRALKVNNQLYRRGLFDPESVSQNFDTYSQKLAGGRYLMALWGWIIGQYNGVEKAANNNGFTTFLIEDSAPVMKTLPTTGGTWPWCLGANCQYPERALEILDWMCSIEGNIVTFYGPQGLCWDYNAEGVPEMTEFGWACQEFKKETEIPAEYGGGTFEDGESKFNNYTLLLEQMIPGKTYSISYKGWPCYADRYATSLSKAWTEDYANGAKNGIELYKQTGKVTVCAPAATSFAKAESTEDTNSKRALFAPVMKQNSWKCVYAETDEEFEAIWKEMVETCKSYGYDDVVAERMVDIQRCFDFIDAAEGK